MSELEEGDGSAAALSWRATVTSAFRASLAATIRAAGPPQAAGNPRGSLDGSTRLGRAAAGRASVDGRGGLRPNGGVPGAAAAAEWPPLLGQRPAARCPAAERFQQWLRLLLFQLLAALAASGTAAEGPWVAALSCLLHLGTHDGRAVRAYLEGLPLSVVAALLEQCRRHRWSEQLHAWLVGLAANLLYRHADEGGEGGYGPHALRGSGSESLRSGGGGSVGAGAVALPREASCGCTACMGRAAACVPLVPAPQPACPERAALPAARPCPAATNPRACPPPLPTGNRGSHGGGDGAPSWWAGSQLDPERLAAFGGLRAVLRCYRAAPCALARRSMFAVLYDRVVSGQVRRLRPLPVDVSAVGCAALCDRVASGQASAPARAGPPLLRASALACVCACWCSPEHVSTATTATTAPHRARPQKPAPEDAWAPVLLQAPHSSESLALGAALLRMGAAEAVHPLFLAGVGGAMQHLADAVSLQASGAGLAGCRVLAGWLAGRWVLAEGCLLPARARACARGRRASACRGDT